MNCPFCKFWILALELLSIIHSGPILADFKFIIQVSLFIWVYLCNLSVDCWLVDLVNPRELLQLLDVVLHW